ncbi:MAG: hypothetical protein NUW21_13945 [Elusimicrobia bacterium]|nr:hypothetical protein [Elusimicrobiota bacterium]
MIVAKRRIYPPLTSRAPERENLSSRRPCPHCGTPDAEVLFFLVRCHNAGIFAGSGEECQWYDPTLEVSDEESDRRRIAAMRKVSEDWLRAWGGGP